MKNDNLRTITTNRKARHDYFILDTHEAGIELSGSEIKAVRNGNINIKDGFVLFRGGEAFLHNVHIAPYTKASGFTGHDPFRVRKLLLHRREIDSIAGKIQRKGLTIVPLSVYIKGNRAKIQIALVKGRKKFDKKQDIISREVEREIEREMKRRR
ncbi:MAG: SsrA-binding protein SmpB [bacterium]